MINFKIEGGTLINFKNQSGWIINQINKLEELAVLNK